MNSNQDKYWEYDEEDLNYKLHFTRFYEDEIIATVFEDEEFSQFYADFEIEDIYESDEPYDLYAETIEEAKLEAEEKFLSLFKSKLNICKVGFISLNQLIRRKKMTEKDLGEFEKEFGFKLLPTSFKKPLAEITKEEYRERIEFLYNAIINDDSNEEDDF